MVDLIKKLEKEAEQMKNYPDDSTLQFYFKYGYVTNGLQNKINELEKKIKS